MVSPGETEEVAPAHATQADSAVAATVVEAFPAVHETQSAAADPPVVARYFPAAQSAQTLSPRSDPYLPCWHGWHVSVVCPVDAPYLPDAHLVQSARIVAPVATR